MTEAAALVTVELRENLETRRDRCDLRGQRTTSCRNSLRLRAHSTDRIARETRTEPPAMMRQLDLFGESQPELSNIVEPAVFYAPIQVKCAANYYACSLRSARRSAFCGTRVGREQGAGRGGRAIALRVRDGDPAPGSGLVRVRRFKSMDKLAETLTAMGHPISADTVRKELVKLGFSRQFNRKSHEGSNHPDRDAQFEHINANVVRRRRTISLSYPSIRRKKSWSATSRTADRIALRKARRAA